MGIFQSAIYYLTIKPKIRRLQKLLPQAEVYPCGSRYVCNPPVLFTDVDFLIYSETCIAAVLLAAGFTESTAISHYDLGDQEPWEKRSVWRKGVINLIVTSSEKFKDRWNVATHLSKRYNLVYKIDRVTVYEAVRGKGIEGMGFVGCCDPNLLQLLQNINGPYGEAIVKAYKAQYRVGL